MIPFKIVDCYSSDIIKQLEECDALLWHFHHKNPKDILFAKQLLYAVQVSGKKTFPDFNTGWHFDDKVGQKYLLESINAPLVSSYVFFSGEEAARWAQSTTYPKVFKLRRGAGSSNVRLIKSKRQAINTINKAFSSGFRLYEPIGGIKERWRRFKEGRSDLRDLFEGVGRFFIKTDFERTMGNEKGYVYFQDFVEDCSFDIRVKVVEKKLWAFKRLVRENDFRASGSSLFLNAPEEIPLELIRTAFEICNKLKINCVAFDFVISNEKKPLLLEMSYAWGYDKYNKSQYQGYWDQDLNWHQCEFNPYGWIIESIVREIRQDQQNLNEN